MIKHCIIGAGPVGLTLGHYFRKHNIPFVVLERKPKLATHPSAHYLNMRTMEILNELNIQLPIEDATQFNNYTYIRRIGEQPFKVTNQSVDYQLHSLNSYAHLPQNILVDTLYNGIKDSVRMGCHVTNVQNGNPIRVTLQESHGKQSTLECEYLYGCDGLNGVVREALQIPFVGQRSIQRFLNVHFESHALLRQVQSYKSMLTFIYNSDISAVLIKHRLESATFAIQIPLDMLTCSNDIEQLKHYQQDYQLIKRLINACCTQVVDDIDIKSVGLWIMGAVVAKQYYQGNCILAGDSCHAMPPAGGFGMNTGIGDAHNLAYKIINQDNLEHYQSERQQIAYDNIKTAMEYYQKSINIAKSLGLDYNMLKTYNQMMSNAPSFIQQFHSMGIKLGASITESDIIQSQLHKQIKDTIPLVFPKEETQYKYTNGNIDTTRNHPLIGQLAPLEIRRHLQPMHRCWYAINMDVPVGLSKYKVISIQLEYPIGLIVRDDMHIYSVNV